MTDNEKKVSGENPEEKKEKQVSPSSAEGKGAGISPPEKKEIKPEEKTSSVAEKKTAEAEQSAKPAVKPVSEKSGEEEPPFDPEQDALVVTLRKKFGDKITAVSCLPLLEDNVTVEVSADAIHEVCAYLRHHPEQLYELCSDCCGNHFDDGHFEVLYHLYSFIKNHRIRLKVRLEGEAPAVDSVTDIWAGMNFFEREIFDLYGITFNNHPDLRRILMPDYWIGHPMRTDYDIKYVPERFRERWWKEGEDGKPELTYDFLTDKRG